MQQPVQQFTNKNQLHILARLGAQIFIENWKMLLKMRDTIKTAAYLPKAISSLLGKAKKAWCAAAFCTFWNTISLSVAMSHTQNEKF